MTLTSTANELALFRRAHVGAARRAAHAWELVCELQNCTVVLPYKKALHFLASSIYFNGRYDAGERYESVEEFEVELEEDFVGKYSERLTVDGVESVVMRPFFGKDWGYLSDMHMSYLRGCDPKEIEALNVKVPELGVSVPEGLTAEEHDALIAYHRSACIKLVNRLRHLWTATHYLVIGLRDAAENKHRTHPEHTMDPRAAGLVAELKALADLPFLPAPCSHYSSDSDRVNTLRTLDADEKTLAPLLATA